MVRDRMILPMGVMRGSSFMGSFQPASLYFSIVRDVLFQSFVVVANVHGTELGMEKGRLFLPTLFCQKNYGAG